MLMVCEGTCNFAERQLWNVGRGGHLLWLDACELDHLAPLLGLRRHIGAELRGGEDQGVVAASASRALMTGFTSPSLISRLSRPMISFGVPLGTPTPCHALASKPGTTSLTVGTSGSPANRVLPATAALKCRMVIFGDHVLGPLKVVIGGEDCVGHSIMRARAQRRCFREA